MADPLGSLVNRSTSPRKLANAIMAPSSIVLAGAATAVAIVSGLGPLSVVVGGLVWAAMSVLGVRKTLRPAPEPIDAFRVGEPWRQYVQSAQQAKVRFDRSVATTRSGPLREHLQEISTRVDTATHECFTIAKKGYALETAVGELDIRQIRRELVAAEAEAAAADPSRRELLESTKESIRSRLASAERLATVTQSTQDQLRQLNAQLDELVARAIELSVSEDSLAAFDTLGTDIDSVVTSMEALRQAMDETSRIGGSLGAGTPGQTMTG